MQLLTAEIRNALPPIGSQEENSDPTIHVKFFTPDAAWTWYATEGSQEEDGYLFFGYVVGVEPEWGYFTLAELQSTRGKLGLAVERDLDFQPCPASLVTEKFKNGSPGGR